MSLHIVGGTVLDVILPRTSRLPTWPRHGEFTPANLVLLREPPIVTLGGNGGNAAYVAARCGAKVTLHTQLGNDAFGNLARGWLRSAGCDVRTPDSTAATGVNVTAANPRQQRATFFHPGEPVRMPSFSSKDECPGHLLVCGWPHPSLDRLGEDLQAIRRRGVFTALDVGPILRPPWSPKSMRSVLSGLDLLLANEYELLQIMRAASLDAAFSKLRRHFADHVVAKRGARGALWLPAGSGESRAVSSRRVRVVNTVGAGDSFNGALLAALTRGAEFVPAIHAACVVAAGVVGSPSGVLGASPTAFEFAESDPADS